MAKQGQPAGPPGVSDDLLRELAEAESLMHDVESALIATGLPITELTVASSARGVVCVFGLAASEEVKLRADLIARAVPGVVEVRNTIIVLPEPDAAAPH